MNMPEEWELIDFFGPSEYKSKPEDGIHCYELIAADGKSICFLLNLFQRSVQVRIGLNGDEILSIYQEGVSNLSIQARPDGKFLVVTFNNTGDDRILKLGLQPTAHVSWEGMVE